MRSFFTTAACERQDVGCVDGATSLDPSGARVAVYDSVGVAPRIVDVAATSPSEFIERTTDLVYRYAREAGGSVPYTAIRELVENFIHAGFCEPVISILDGGTTIRFADQGPGIRDKHKALVPGFTTATSDMKKHIRGVGSGLPIVSEFLSLSGGSLEIEDNLGNGCVVTVCAGPSVGGRRATDVHHSIAREETAQEVAAAGSSLPGMEPFRVPARLSSRQKRVLALVLETGSAGPSLVSKELSIAVSTAHRDLAHLEGLGLIESDDEGKRGLTDRGMAAADELLR